MKKFSELTEAKEPKRSIRRTIAGNIQGYVGGKHYRHIGDAHYQPMKILLKNGSKAKFMWMLRHHKLDN